MTLGSQDSLNDMDNAGESLIEQSEHVSPGMANKPRDWNRKKGMRVMVVSCLVFAIAVTVALVVDVCTGEHYTGHAAISTEQKECSEIGSNLMKKGGNAVDAAIGAMFCIGLLNSESSGIGGGGFMVVSLPNHGEKVIDFRDTAPQSATSDMFYKDPSLAKQGGLAVAVPGELKGLELAHMKYGKLKWSELVEPTIKLAREGFTITKHTVKFLSMESVQKSLKTSKELMEIFAPNGKFLKEGAKMKNLKLADTLSKIAEHGSKAVYEGPIAQSIVDAVRKRNGNLTLADLKNYKPLLKDCLYSEYQGYQIMTAPLPSGGPLVVSALNILERFNLTKKDQTKNATYQYITEAFKFMFAQRSHLGDPADPENSHVLNYTTSMVSKQTAADIQYKISKDKTHPSSYYSPASVVKPDHGTAHVSVLSPDGEMVSVTSTINDIFGSYIMTDTGIVLNNEMDDFSTDQPYYKANVVKPGKRPLSSCSPVIVKHKQDSCLYMAIGGSGGIHIPTSVVQVLVNILSFGDTLQDAVERPRLHHHLIPDVLEIEGDRLRQWDMSSIVDYLRKVGHTVKTKGGSYANVHIAENNHAKLRAYSDSRRMGSGIVTY